MEDDDKIFQHEKVDMRAGVPRELYQEALLCGAAMGLNKSDIVVLALQKFVGDSGIQGMKANFLQRKAQQLDTTEVEISEKVIEAYDDIARRKRGRLPSSKDDES
ncbi:MAG: hypothetical protein AAF810_22225 [Cyanobacteria bacterium P01_D01_bin.36]